MKLKENEPLKRHSTFRIGGPARYFAEPKNEKEARKALLFAKKKRLPVFFLGNGSNLLFSDRGFKGLVLKYSDSRIRISGRKIIAASGAYLARLVRLSVKNKLTGLEFLVGIPGLVGGAVAMNPGWKEFELSPYLKKVKLMNSSGKIKRLNKERLGLGYRQSMLQKNRYLVLEAELALKKGSPGLIKKNINYFISARKGSQPLNLPSAGSVFKNPKGGFAGRLIEKAGCKGMRSGGAQVSKKHANFIVNLGKATSRDVKDLIKKVRSKVKKSSGISLDPEIILVAEK